MVNRILIAVLFVVALMLLANEAQARTYAVELTGTIASNNVKVREIFTVLSIAKRGDTVIINVDSTGGWVQTSDSITRAITKSPAHVITHNKRRAYSGAMPIALAGDCISAAPGAKYLFHRPSYRVSQKDGHRKQTSAELDRFFIKTLAHVAPGFLKAREREIYYNGYDIIYKRSAVYRRLSHKICQ